MDAFSATDFRQLLHTQAEACVSIYIPTEPAGEAGQAGPIELKNLLTQAEDDWVAKGTRPATVREILEPARSLLSDPTFWKSQSNGLALFLANGSLRTWRLPLKFAPFVWIGQHLHLKPLLPLIEDDDRFFVLAVSQNNVKLYAGNRQGLTEIHVGKLPKNLSEALHYHQPEGMFQVRSFHAAGVHGSARGKSAKEGAVFHGQGGGAEHDKADLLAYFRVIDRGLSEFLRSESAPLLFAGVEYLFPLYREANSYPALVDSPVHGNPARWNTVELHARAKPIMAPYWNRTRQQDIQRLQDLIGGNQVSCDIESVLPAAQQGRVDAVFVAADGQLWGSFDSATQHVQVVEERQGTGEDLLDLVARLALTNGGRAYAVPTRDLPTGLLLSALYRYGA